MHDRAHRRLAGLAACLLAAALGAAAGPAQPNPYVLTQAFCITLPPGASEPVASAQCRKQVVPVGAILQIQVPGTPSEWDVIGGPGNLVGTDAPVRIGSPGRITGASEIWVFTYRAMAAGEGVVTLSEYPRNVTPRGEFRFPVEVR